MQLWTVYRSGGEYTPEHVGLLRDQLKRHNPEAKLVCLSDVPGIPADVTVLQTHKWAGWWAKMDLFNPALDELGDILYCDLDTILLANPEPLTLVQNTTLLRDFFCEQAKDKHYKSVGSGFMFLRVAERRRVWRFWIENPRLRMRQAGAYGDQLVIQRAIGEQADRWQDILPGLVVSYKVHARKGPPADEALVCCFHGQPRPWDVTHGWVPDAIRGQSGPRDNSAA